MVCYIVELFLVLIDELLTPGVVFLCEIFVCCVYSLSLGGKVKSRKWWVSEKKAKRLVAIVLTVVGWIM